MRRLDQCRTLEILQADGTWVAARWEQLDEGDIFRLYEVGTNDLVVGSDGHSIWVAAGPVVVSMEARTLHTKVDVKVSPRPD